MISSAIQRAQAGEGLAGGLLRRRLVRLDALPLWADETREGPRSERGCRRPRERPRYCPARRGTAARVTSPRRRPSSATSVSDYERRSRPARHANRSTHAECGAHVDCSAPYGRRNCSAFAGQAAACVGVTCVGAPGVIRRMLRWNGPDVEPRSVGDASVILPPRPRAAERAVVVTLTKDTGRTLVDAVALAGRVTGLARVLLYVDEAAVGAFAHALGSEGLRFSSPSATCREWTRRTVPTATGSGRAPG